MPDRERTAGATARTKHGKVGSRRLGERKTVFLYQVLLQPIAALSGSADRTQPAAGG